MHAPYMLAGSFSALKKLHSKFNIESTAVLKSKFSLHDLFYLVPVGKDMF